MIRIAIVEDEAASAELLNAYVNKYSLEQEEEVKAVLFKNGYDFLDGYKINDFDVVLMDIEMPKLNGIETAKNLRLIDEYVSLIFVTNMAQYAISGYEVGALDFMLKPVGYVNFVTKLNKAIRAHKKYEDKFIYVASVLGMVKVNYADIRYIESDKHYLFIHTDKEKLKMRGSIRSAEKDFETEGFARCGNSFLINLKHVTKVGASEIIVGSDVLPLTRAKKNEFMQKLTLYMGRGIL